MMEAEIGDEGPQFVAPILFHLMPALEHTAQTLRISSIRRFAWSSRMFHQLLSSLAYSQIAGSVGLSAHPLRS